MPIPVAEQSKVWVCGRSLAGIAGSNAAGAVDDCLLWVLCVVRYRPLRRADPSSRGVLPSVVCLSVIVKPWQGWGLGQLELSSHAIYIYIIVNLYNQLQTCGYNKKCNFLLFAKVETDEFNFL